MYCKNCGTQISDDSKFCRKCGTKVIDEQPYPGMYGEDGVIPPRMQMPQTYFTPTLVLMIISIVFGLLLAIPFSITAFVLACVAKKQYNLRTDEQGAKYARLAKIFMWVGVVLMIITIVIVGVFVAQIMEELAEVLQHYPQSEWEDVIEQYVQQYFLGANN